MFYELTPKVDLSLGYAHTQTDVDETNRSLGGGFSSYVSDYETASHFFNVGARGQLLPKLSGFFKIGYRTRDSDDSTLQTLLNGSAFGPAGQTNRDGSNGMLGLNADFTWNATPKLTTRLGLSRDFGVGSEGGTTENSAINLNASYSINANWSSQANAGYTLRDYDSGREDNQYSLGLRLSYVPNQHWRFSGGYSYSENDSTIDNRSYESHTLDITAAWLLY